jgi:hypothetical protein
MSSLLWLASDIAAGLRYEGYDFMSRTISELGAIGSPARSMLLVTGFAYSALLLAFGFGVFLSAERSRGLRIAGALIVTHGLVAFMAPLFPMNPREGSESLTDVMHLVHTGVTVLLILLTIGFASGATGKWFRVFSIATLVTLFVAGVLTGIEGPKVAADQPTPWIGFIERVNVWGYMVWVIALSVVLLREASHRAHRALHPVTSGSPVTTEGIAGDRFRMKSA